MPPSTWGAPTRPLSLSSKPVFNLEALREALLFDRMLAVGGADFHARLAGREDLPRVAEPARIERLLHAVHAGEIGLGEDERHVVDLLEPDAVLAGDGAAHLGADLQDLAARGDHPRLLARVSRVVEAVGMELPVPGMKAVAVAKAVGGD